MLPNYYEFQNSTKILSGSYALENISTELDFFNAKRALLLSDETIQKLGLLHEVKKEISCEVLSYTSIPINSDLEIIKEIVALFKKENCDSIVAVGGGSVIDTAKGVRMVLSQKVQEIEQIMGAECLCYGKHIPFIAIPTTTGTGSEVTSVAVILDRVKQTKMEFLSYFLSPDVAILDPKMTKTLPSKVIAMTGIDALCHAIEAYTSLQKNPMSDAYANLAVKLIGENLLYAVTRKREETIFAMANAALIAGVSFSNSMVGLVHAIGHALGSVCGIPHAEAMSLLLPICMRYNQDKVGFLYGELLLPFAGEEVYLATQKEYRCEKMIQEVEKLVKTLQKETSIPTTLNCRGFDQKVFPLVVEKAMNDGALLVNQKEVTKQDILQILEKIK